MTNFEKIKSLDVRAMAEFLNEFQEDAFDVCIMVDKEDCNGKCTECIRAWLEDEAEIKPITELKPCPFCGGEAMLSDVDDRDDPFVIVLCEKCGIGTPRFYYYDPLNGINSLDLAKTRVSEKWNRRVDDDTERIKN